MRHKLSASLVALTLALTQCPMAHAKLTVKEQQLADFVDANKTNEVTFLQKLVDVHSGTHDVIGVRKTGEIAANALKELGFSIFWKNEPEYMHRAPTLVAELKSSKNPKILLIGHLDTVFSKNVDFHSFRVKGNKGKGQGAADDKGGVAVIVYALKALKEANLLNKGNIIVVLTGDEESSGKPASISRKPLFVAAKNADYALDFEPSVTLKSATIARRGFSAWKIVSHGNAAHSAGVFRKGVGAGAILNLSYQLNNMYDKLKDVKHLTFNPGIIAGGNKINIDSKNASISAIGKTNIVAKTAVAKGEMRYISVKQKDWAKTQIREIVAKHLPYTKSEVDFVDGIPPMSETPANKKLLQAYSTASKDLGYGKVVAIDPDLKGAADISYVADRIKANLSGLGPTGYGEHTAIEEVYLSSLPIQTKRAAVLIHRLLENHIH